MRFRDAGKLFCQYAVPQMTGLLFNSVYLLVDGIFIGRLLGRNCLAAAGIRHFFISRELTEEEDHAIAR